MRHSINVKISALILCSVLCLVAAIVFLNTFFLNKYYMSQKLEAFEKNYSEVDTYLTGYEAGDITEGTFKRALDGITETNNISIMIINEDWSIVYASMQDVDDFRNRLQNSLFNKIIIGEDIDKINDLNTVVTKEKYSIYNIYNSNKKDNYLELIGNMSNGTMIYMSLAVRSIQQNVEVANRFIMQVGILMAVIASGVAFLLGRVISKPVLELADIAKEMSEMNFEIKYKGEDKSEIGKLGKSMNLLSSKLEKNISELKSANIELLRDIEIKEKSENMRKEFLSNVSHELKTPIALIQGYAEGLKEGISEDPESMEFYCDVIIDEASKMNQMVKKLLTLNQMESGTEQIELERFKLAELVEAVVASKRLLFEQKEIKVELKLNNEVYVWADEYRIEEVVNNYLTNAINHCEGNKKIIISIEKDNEHARLNIFNTGKNIPEEDIDRIWDKFYKVDKARTREYGGNGIGLSIVKAIMEQHRQKCGVNNVQDGVEFWIELDVKI